ncbi:MAG: peptidase T, partial [Firmicutes bacterium]|nr:peptidase T [Bacillota bacterium]
MSNLVERFLKYVKEDTASVEGSDSFPSTATQIDFAKKLADELSEIGLKDVSVDENGYVFATVPANTDKPFHTVGFIAHMDTAPDAPGKNVCPILHENYNGEDMVLKNNVVISPAEFPALKKYMGDTIITSDGTTLLGADDKAGVAEIVTAAEYLLKTDEPHGI